MAISLDPKQIVLNDELLLSEMVSQEAIVRLLVQNGIFAKEDFLEMVENVNLDMAKMVQESRKGGAKWTWIDFDSGIIRLPKTKTLNDPDSRGQEIVMQKELIEYLKTIPVKSECVLCLEDEEKVQRVRHWHFYERFEQILKTVGIDAKEYAPQELRHTTGTLMYLKGGQVKTVTGQLRHDDQKTTIDFYIGANPDYQSSQNEVLVLQNQVAQAQA